jgi:outer membrane protein
MLSLRVFAAGLLCGTLALLPAQAQAQSLAQALTNAYEYSPELQAALIDAKSAAEDIALAKADKLPTIGASLSGTYNWSVAGGNFNDSTALDAGLSYNQTLFDNFRTEARIEQARAAADAAEHTIRNTEQNVLIEVVQAYMTVVRDRQLVSLREDNVSFFRAQLQSARDQLEVGEGTRIDVAQAEARLAQSDASYRSAITNLQTSTATFQRYVGAAPQSLSTQHNYRSLIPGSIDAAIALAEEQHPAILLAKAAIRSTQAGTDAAQAAFGPTLTLNGSVGSGLSSEMMSGQGGVNGQVRLNLQVPIYAGGALGASVRRANLQQVKSEVDALSTYDQIREAVIASWSGIQNAESQILSAQAAVAAGQQVVDGVIQERDLGTRTTLDVLNAQAELTSAREGLISAQTSQVVATFSLLASIGRLTATDLGLAVAVKSAESYTREVEDVWQELRTIED